MRKLRRVALGRDLYRSGSHVYRVAAHFYFGGEAAMDGIVAQQVRIRGDRPEIVDGYDLNVGAAGFYDCSQDITANPAKPVYGDAHGHQFSPLGSRPAPRADGGLAEVLHHRAHDGLGGDAEVPVKVFIGRARPE